MLLDFLYASIELAVDEKDAKHRSELEGRHQRASTNDPGRAEIEPSLKHVDGAEYERSGDIR